MTTNQDWAALSERLEALALKLKLHMRQTGAANAVPQALTDMRDAVEDAFDAAGNAVHDPAVRTDLRDVGRLLAEAVSNALTEAGDDVRAALARRR